MYTVYQLPEFATWLSDIKDGMTRRRLARRLEKAQHGHLGDIKAVGEGVWEMREFFGPGWRMYYVQRGDVVIVMLGVAWRLVGKAPHHIEKYAAFQRDLEEEAKLEAATRA